MADGTDQSMVTPTGVQTVTAAAGGTVDIRLQAVDDVLGSTAISCRPLESGHLASIPVRWDPRDGAHQYDCRAAWPVELSLWPPADPRPVDASEIDERNGQ